jgi:hypothetical protein
LKIKRSKLKWSSQAQTNTHDMKWNDWHKFLTLFFNNKTNNNFLNENFPTIDHYQAWRVSLWFIHSSLLSILPRIKNNNKPQILFHLSFYADITLDTLFCLLHLQIILIIIIVQHFYGEINPFFELYRIQFVFVIPRLPFEFGCWLWSNLLSKWSQTLPFNLNEPF